MNGVILCEGSTDFVLLQYLMRKTYGWSDADFIRKGNLFVEEIDSEKRYLTKRRYITKAKFDVYFSIRTAAEQFVERQNIMKDIAWEKYVLIQESFQKLEEL